MGNVQAHSPDNALNASSSSSDGSVGPEENNQEVVAEVQPVPATHSMTTRARSGIIKPNPRYALFTVKEGYPEPRSVKAALKDPR